MAGADVDWIDPGAPSTMETLEVLRTTPLRRPLVVLSLWDVWMGRMTGSGTVSYWSTIEQVAFAAADVADWRTFEWCVRKIFGRFGSSWRANRLFGIKREARGEYEQASTIYANMLEADPHNRAVLKRQVVLFKTRGMLPESIAHLNWYLSIYSSDATAWCEAADLYITVGKHAQAIFCLNEALLLTGDNWAFFLTLGDVHYTLGDEENMLIARKYYSKSLVCNNQSNVRALYGLLMCTRALEGNTSRSQESKNGSLRSWAEDGLRLVYKDNAKCMPLVESLFSSKS